MHMVKQENDAGCGVACIAMILGMTYAEADLLFTRDLSKTYPDLPLSSKMGVIVDEMAWIMFRRGVASASYVPKDAYPSDGWVYRYYEELEIVHLEDVIDHVESGAKTVLGVPSLNTPGLFHWVVTYGGMAFDPGHGRKQYTSVDQALKAGIASALLVQS